MRRSMVVPVVLVVALLGALAGTAQAGQIVYRHGEEIWAMNDDGSGQHPLLTAAQVPGAPPTSELGGPDVFPNGGTNIAFEGTTLAYAAPAGSGPAGSCGIDCTGVYVMSGGSIARVTDAPAPCGPAPAWCGSFATSPFWMASGNLLYENSIFTWEYSCLFFPCSWEFSASKYDIDVVAPAAGAGVGSPWSLEKEGNTIDARPDPADASKLSYIGAIFNCEHECVDPLYISAGGAPIRVVVDDALKEASWSPDGARFADVEGGGSPGIWTYPAAEESGGTTYVWALEDPIKAGNPFETTFSYVSWLGTSQIMFEADYNLWTIPASCGVSGAPSNPCHFPADAHQLTFDGTKESADTEPSWTSSTAPFVAPAAPGSPAGAGSSTGSGNSGTPAAGAASVGSVKVNGNTVGVTLACAGASTSRCVETVQLVVVETLRGSKIVAVQARRAKKRTVVVGSATVTLTGGQSTVLKLSLNRTGQALLKRYHTLHAGLKVSQTVGTSVHVVGSATLTLKAPRKHH